MDHLSGAEFEGIRACLPKFNPELQSICQFFLFCCYTGLRFRNAMNIGRSEIKELPPRESTSVCVERPKGRFFCQFYLRPRPFTT